MKFSTKLEHAKIMGLSATVKWSDDFENWAVVCIGGTRRYFSHDTPGFPVDVTKYGEGDSEKLMADLSNAVPGFNFILK